MSCLWLQFEIITFKINSDERKLKLKKYEYRSSNCEKGKRTTFFINNNKKMEIIVKALKKIY